MNMRKKRLTMVGLALAVGAALVACGGGSASAGPKSLPGWETVVPNDETTVDVESFCNHGNRVYLSHQGRYGIAVAAADPSCAGVAR